MAFILFPELMSIFIVADTKPDAGMSDLVSSFTDQLR